jgi:hypothetical protein
MNAKTRSSVAKDAYHSLLVGVRCADQDKGVLRHPVHPVYFRRAFDDHATRTVIADVLDGMLQEGDLFDDNRMFGSGHVSRAIRRMLL